MTFHQLPCGCFTDVDHRDGAVDVVCEGGGISWPEFTADRSEGRVCPGSVFYAVTARPATTYSSRSLP